MTSDKDLDTVSDALEVLSKNGFTVSSVNSVHGYEDYDYDNGDEEPVELGHVTSAEIKIRKEHY